MRFPLVLFLLALAACAGANPDSLAMFPAEVVLTGPKAVQRLIVEIRDGNHYSGDLTSHAVFASSNPSVAVVSRDGTVRAMANGVTNVTANVNGRVASIPVRVERVGAPFVWSFRNHVLPMMTKAGCNGGSCHGAAAGKGGMKLSLRGFDPVSDYNVLSHQAGGRRVVTGNPGASLMVLKPTMAIGHGGGERIKKGSRDYEIVAGWISAGAPRPRPTDAVLKGLEVYPSAAILKPGDSQQVLVTGRYSDGHSEDVTRWVKFGTSDSMVATVDDNGLAKVTGSGEAAITVWFSSRVAFARIVSPFEAAGDEPRGARGTRGTPFSSGPMSPVVDKSFIDELIDKKLEELNLPASGACTDSEFVRRAYLDACGILPRAREVEAFLADRRADKRARLVDSLLARPEFVDYWTYMWCDLLLVSSRKLGGSALTSFYDWIRESVAANKPWDRFAREIITATGSNLDNGAANYYLLHKDPIDLSETTTQAFMGMSIQCAHCHNHPLEKWTQRQYYQMANLFARVRLKNGDRPGEALVLTASDGYINHPRLGVPLPPAPLDGPEMGLDDSRDRREVLAQWLTSPENPYFAKALVNRVWRSLMGRGIVEAEDDLRLTNPPSNQELLDALAADFVKGGYDVKRLIREIMLTAAYQRSASPVGINAKDDRCYSHYLVRRMPAEVLLDAISEVTGIPTDFAGVPRGTRALQLKDSQVASYFLSAFGRPERALTCSCERQSQPTVAQALHLSNGDTLNDKLRARGGLIDSLIESDATDDEVLDEVYLAALSRKPTEAERKRLLPILAQGAVDMLDSDAKKRSVRRPVIEDLMWAVLTDREFLFNH